MSAGYGIAGPASWMLKSKKRAKNESKALSGWHLGRYVVGFIKLASVSPLL
jgi:hypothetical protein